jgi:spermidine synthase
MISLLLGALAMAHGDLWLTLPAGSGGTFGRALAGEALLALAAVGLPTVFMGALFAQQAAEARAAGATTGTALAINTVAAMLAAPMVALLLIPALGASSTALVLAGGYLLLLSSQGRRDPLPWLAATALVAMTLYPPELNPVAVPEGGRILFNREGVIGAVSVTETPGGGRILRIDNHQQEGAAPVSPSERRQAWLPLLLHAQPKSLLLLGLGTGGTAMAAAADATLAVTAIELLPEVVAAMPLFVDADARQPEVRVADARRHIRTDRTQHDVIVADLFHPARGGTSSLYTVEHFRAVRERLNEGGVFVQWLPLHQLDLDTLQSIVAAYLQAFPEARAMLATNSLDTPVLGLIGRDGPLPAPVTVDNRIAAVNNASTALNGLQLDDAMAVLGSVIADAAALKSFAEGAVINRDHHPVVAYRAPRLTYAADSAPRDRLYEMLSQVSATPVNVFGEALSPDIAERVRRYWQARNNYLAAGRVVTPQADPAALLAQVRDPLLEVLSLSPDFRPAYEPLLRLSLAIAGRDPGAARALLTMLIERAPQRPEAAQALAMLGSAQSP